MEILTPLVAAIEAVQAEPTQERWEAAWEVATNLYKAGAPFDDMLPLLKTLAKARPKDGKIPVAASVFYKPLKERNLVV